MKKASVLLIITFVLYLIGQIIWGYTIFIEPPLFGSKYFEDLTLLFVYTLSGISGLLSGIEFYKAR